MPSTSEKPAIIVSRPGDKYDPNISEEQELLIGRMIVSWSQLEQAIEEVIWEFLQLPIAQGRIITSPLDAKYKINMLRGLGIKQVGKDDLKDFHSIIKLMRYLYAHRSTIAHGVWVTLPNGDPAALSLKTKVPEEFDQAKVIVSAYPSDFMNKLIWQTQFAMNALIDLRRMLAALPEM